MNLLPLELVEYIAKTDNKTWFVLVQTYKFLYEKSLDNKYVDDLKRKFLRYLTGSGRKINNCSNIYQHRNKMNYYEYYNNEVVYYLPNGTRHTFEEPCIFTSDYCHVKFYIWYKDGNIHRDNDLPAIIIDCESPYDEISFGAIYSYMDSIIESLNNNDIIPYDFYLDDAKIWVQNNCLYRGDGLPIIVREELDKNNMHRDRETLFLLENGEVTHYVNDVLKDG